MLEAQISCLIHSHISLPSFSRVSYRPERAFLSQMSGKAPIGDIAEKYRAITSFLLRKLAFSPDFKNHMNFLLVQLHLRAANLGFLFSMYPEDYTVTFAVMTECGGKEKATSQTWAFINLLIQSHRNTDNKTEIDFNYTCMYASA